MYLCMCMCMYVFGCVAPQNEQCGASEAWCMRITELPTDPCPTLTHKVSATLWPPCFALLRGAPTRRRKPNREAFLKSRGILKDSAPKLKKQKV